MFFLIFPNIYRFLYFYSFKMDKETQFLSGLLELQYDAADISSLTKLSSSISWAKGWPDNGHAFWNAEAFMWSKKIDKTVRRLIEDELAILPKKRNYQNLDLGCGAYSYLPSVGFDLSEKMLLFNERCAEKIIGNLEEKLPFADASFDSVTAIFVLNYVQNYNQLFCEIKRILRVDGQFVMILSATPINNWQRQKEVNGFNVQEWISLLKVVGFDVELNNKDNLLFFKCRKAKFIKARRD